VKKTFLIIGLFILVSFNSSGQTAYEAGLRFGDQWGSAVAIDGTIPLGISPRLHPTIYLGDGGVGLASYFDWMFALNNTPSGLRFYPGVGPELIFSAGPANDVEFAIAGVLGAEYAFDFPLTVGFDWRPSWAITGLDGNDFKAGFWGFIARYRFTEVKLKKTN